MYAPEPKSSVISKKSAVVRLVCIVILNPIETSMLLRSFLYLSSVCPLDTPRDGLGIISIETKWDREELFHKGIKNIQHDEVIYISAVISSHCYIKGTRGVELLDPF